MTKPSPFKVVILAYPGMTMLDAIGPNEVLGNSPHFDVSFAAAVQDPIENDLSSFAMTNMRFYREIEHADILLIPGGPGDHKLMQDSQLLDWIRQIDQQSQLTTSVCSGSLVLGKAGLLKGIKACCHWACLGELGALDAKPVRRRFVQDGKYVTASGVSAGIDMALYLVESLVDKAHAKEIRFGIEYFPNQLNLVSSYTLPRDWMTRLASKVEPVINAGRARFL